MTIWLKANKGIIVGWLTLVALGVQVAHGDTITLRNGMQVQGRVGKIASIHENPLASRPDPEAATPIVFTDDGLRRTFFPNKQIKADGYAAGGPNLERIRIDKRVAASSKRIGTVGPVVKITPFDKFGNRRYTMLSSQGPLDVIQGITEITPVYTKVEGLVVEQAYVWDMRVATSSIPRDTLSSVLRRAIDPKNANQRLQVVRLFTQAERFEDARQELAECIADFPELADLKKQEQQLVRLSADRLLSEVDLRRKVGQPQHAVYLLQQLKSLDAEVLSDETSVRVRELLGEFQEQFNIGKNIVGLLKSLSEKVSGDKLRSQIKPVIDEIAMELNFETLPRMADFLRLADDESMTPEQRISLAISGWIMGNGEGTPNLAVAMSTVEVRGLVRQYLRSKQPAERERILEQLTSMEGASMLNVAKILANMKPPLDPPQADAQSVPGLFEVQVPGTTEQAEFTYHIQLPPQYDPYRRYPCVVTLGSTGLKAKDQLLWWTGTYDAERGLHTGQAPRHGYIVIAVDWVAERQRGYEYSAREHAAVLYSLRDACRRFSIDSDRVFLSGHSSGGEAAWDIGLAHPDLWAGVIPIVAGCDKYIGRYTDNGRLLPMYFVGGELDGDKMRVNGVQFDRYMKRVGYDIMVTDYLGRGHEHFQEDLPRIIDWMNYHKRDFFPKDWNVVSMRPWDNFFWFTEFHDFVPRTMTSPANWPPPPKTTPATLSGTLLENNGVSVNAGGAKATVWFCPEMVDFNKKILLNGRTAKVVPSLGTMLEDVRTRADRQHPFWAKVDM